MARSTAAKNPTPPKGMMAFRVIDATIKDSIGQYCVAGDLAVLTRAAAQSYLDKGHIRVELPDNFGEPDPQPTPQSEDEASNDTGDAQYDRTEAVEPETAEPAADSAKAAAAPRFGKRKRG